MKAFALVTRNNNHIAKDLLYPIKELNIVFSITDEKNIELSYKAKNILHDIDIVFVFIDETTNENIVFQKELNYILDFKKEKMEEFIVPIIINGAEVPKQLKHLSFVSYDSSSKDSLEIPRKNIETLIQICKIKKAINYRKTHKYNSLIYIITLPSLALLITAICLILLSQGSMSRYELPMIMTSISFCVTIFAITLCFLYLLRRRLYEDKKEDVDTFSNKLDWTIVSKEPAENEDDKDQEVEEKSEIDPLGLMKFNLIKIKEFYSWSQSQAKASFLLAVFMSILGFLLVIAGVILPIVLKLSIQIAFIPAIGGVITELIAGTALVVYRSSISQVNYYHNALHENERFLTSVALLNKFSTTEAQDEMLKEIIRSEIQMNMYNADRRENSKKKKI